MPWINGKQIFQGKEVHRCPMQGVGWETERGVSVKPKFIYRSTLNFKKYSVSVQSQSKSVLINMGHLRESQT